MTERRFVVSANSVLEPDATTELVVRDCEAERCTAHGKRIVELVRWHGVDLTASPWWRTPIWHADAEGCPTAPCLEGPVTPSVTPDARRPLADTGGERE